MTTLTATAERSPENVKKGGRRLFLGKKERERIGNVIAWIILAIGAFASTVPFLWMVSTSLKNFDEVYSWPPSFIPQTIQWGNYIEAWRRLPFGIFFRNSAYISVCVALGQMFTCSLAGYSFSRLRFPGRDTIFLLYLATMMVPFAVIMIPLFITMRTFGWVDSHLALIVPGLVSVYGTFLMRQFMATLPKELEDAARVDGCSFFRLYLTIILPSAKPALATLGILEFMGTWNDFLWPLIVLNAISKKTLPLGLLMFQAQSTMKTPWHLMMASATFAILPILVVFTLGQKYYVQGIVTSGIKGGA
jgi:multiple sugar transport system permease protein